MAKMHFRWLARPFIYNNGQTPGGRYVLYHWHQQRGWVVVGGVIREYSTDRYFAFLGNENTVNTCSRPALVESCSQGRFVTRASLRSALAAIKASYPRPIDTLAQMEFEWSGKRPAQSVTGIDSGRRRKR
jgi:hypothetical protein